MTKQIISFFFAILILMSSNGLIISTHQCFKKICAEGACNKTWQLFTKQSCCNVKKESPVTEKKCCSSSAKYVKVSNADVVEVKKTDKLHKVEKEITEGNFHSNFRGSHTILYAGVINPIATKNIFSPNLKYRLSFHSFWRC